MPALPPSCHRGLGQSAVPQTWSTLARGGAAAAGRMRRRRLRWARPDQESRADKMRIRARCLTHPMGLLFCFAFSCSALARERLPEIVKRIAPSTVSIVTYHGDGEGIGQGSGSFVSQKGDIITNRQVLEDCSGAGVKFPEGKVYTITGVVAENKQGDIVRADLSLMRRDNPHARRSQTTRSDS